MNGLEELNEFLEIAVNAIDEKLGHDIKVIDITEISVLANYFIIVHGNNTPQLNAIAENIDFRLSKAGYEPKSIEGTRNGGWTLMDYGHTIIHVFGKDERLFYDLERLWLDGKHVILETLKDK
jgi:ribosome-associated protein